MGLRLLVRSPVEVSLPQWTTKSPPKEMLVFDWIGPPGIGSGTSPTTKRTAWEARMFGVAVFAGMASVGSRYCVAVILIVAGPKRDPPGQNFCGVPSAFVAVPL